MSVELVGNIVTAVGVFVVAWQLHEANNTARADFILRLEQRFASDLWGTYNAVTQEEGKGVKPDQIEIYLSFFERLHALRRIGRIDMETLDHMFAYRFFAVANRPGTIEILKRAGDEHWVGLRELYFEWMDHRERQNRPTVGDTTPLFRRARSKSGLSPDGNAGPDAQAS